MQIEKFRYLIQLAESGSFYAAAKETYLSQQGLSKAIATLESELGTELIVRGPRGVTFTPAGQIALEHARIIVEDYDRLTDELLRLVTTDENGPRHVRVRTTPYGMKCLDSIDRNFAFTHAFITESTFDEMMKRLDSLDDDELIVFGAPLSKRKEIEARKDLTCVTFAPARWGIIVHESSPFAQLDHVDPQNLVDIPSATPSNQELAMLTEWVIDPSILTDVRLRTNSSLLLRDFLASTPDGFAFCDSFLYYLTQHTPFKAVPNATFIPLATDRAYIELVGIARSDTPHPMLSSRALEWIANRIADRNQAYFKTRSVDFKQ